jgi:hypothetical protein
LSISTEVLGYPCWAAAEQILATEKMFPRMHQKHFCPITPPSHDIRGVAL